MSRTPVPPPKNKDAEKEDASFLDQTLRPKKFEHYIGQEGIKKNLRILLDAAAERNHPPEHLLFYGPPGLGKTTLAHLIAHETARQLRSTSGPAIEKVGDLAAILTNLTPGDILFIDEIHRLNKLIEEVLYPAMESGMIDIVIGKGPSARSIQLSLPPFTLIAATTRASLISSPLRSRFSGGTFRLEFYTEEEISKIVKQSAEKLGVKLGAGAAEEIAKRSRATPRTANYLLKRCRDFAQLKRGELTNETVAEALRMLDIDEIGLTTTDRLILRTIIEKFSGGPVGVKTVAAAISEEEDTIEEVHEPYLLQLGLIDRTNRGRIATPRAYEHLGYELPPEHPSNQKKLI